MLSICIPRIELGTRAQARTKEVKRALAMKAEFIFMMDSDQVVPVAGMSKLYEAVLGGADIAVIDCPNKGVEDTNIRYHPDGTLAYASISCCMLRAGLFTDLPTRPWFSSEYAYVEEGVKDGKITWRVEKKYQDDNVGEDIWFIRHVIEAGMKVEVIPELKCSHFDLA